MPKLRADLELEGGARVTGLLAGVAGDEPATVGQLPEAIANEADLPPDDIDIETLLDLLDLVDPHELAQALVEFSASKPASVLVSGAYGTVAANTTTAVAFSFPGARAGATAAVANPVSALAAGLVVAWVASLTNDQVSVAIRNTTAAGISAGSVGLVLTAWPGLVPT